MFITCGCNNLSIGLLGCKGWGGGIWVGGMMTSWNGNIFRLTGPLVGNSPVTGEFPAQRPVERSFDVSFDLRLNKRLSKQWWGWWFKTPSRPLWRHCNGLYGIRALTTESCYDVDVVVNGGSSDDEVGIMATFSFQYGGWGELTGPVVTQPWWSWEETFWTSSRSRSLMHP